MVDGLIRATGQAAPVVPVVHPAGAVAYLFILLCGIMVNLWWWRRWRASPDYWEGQWRGILDRPVRGGDLGILMVILFVLLTAAGVVIRTASPDDSDMTTAMLVMSIAFHWPVIVYLAIRYRVAGITWFDAFGIQRRGLGRALCGGTLAYLGMMPIVFVYMMAYHLCLRTLQVDIELQDVAHAITQEPVTVARLYFYLLGIIIAPVAEELLFRGVLFPLLARWVGLLPGVLLVSVLFAAIHWHVPSLLPLFVVSVCLCMAYAYSRSLTVPIVMHILFNAVHLLLLQTQ